MASAAPRVLVLRAAGTNCDAETANAFELAGATARALHINRLFERPQELDDADILAVPGGFSYGDDVGSGKILAIEIRTRLGDALQSFIGKGRLVLGICNGFQVLVKSGLLPHGAAGLQRPGLELDSTLTWNTSRHYECRWVRVGVTAPADSPFLRGIDQMWLPVAHAEGRFISAEATLDGLDSPAHGEPGTHGVVRYIDADGKPADSFPANPNGSQRSIAGMSDATGQVFGLMPHPERHVRFTQRPDWTRWRGTPAAAGDGDGLAIFRNAVAHVRG
ncbi:MAG: phosphoribosylformylglycinamidine synthase subunit PurQ [Planctomycetota bacterium]